jgi:hypothetical protein
MNSVDDYITQTIDIIAEHGWLIQWVGDPVDEAEPSAPFAYTVGLTALGHPELIVTGLPPEKAYGILQTLAERIRDNTEALVEGELLERVIGEPYLVRVGAVCERELAKHLTIAQAIYGDEVKALQIIWPDGMNRLPGALGYSIPATAQPILEGASDEQAH